APLVVGPFWASTGRAGSTLRYALMAPAAFGPIVQVQLAGSVPVATRLYTASPIAGAVALFVRWTSVQLPVNVMVGFPTNAIDAMSTSLAITPPLTAGLLMTRLPAFTTPVVVGET